MVDLRVWAALCGLLRQQVHHPPPDDPRLDRASERTVHTTGYQLATWFTARTAEKTTA